MTEEEILARKLFGYFLNLFVLVVFAGLVYYAASYPPQKPAPQPDVPAVAKETQKDDLQSFLDRLATLRLRSGALPERIKEAETLLAKAPTAELRQKTGELLEDLKREQQEQDRFEKRAAFLSLKNDISKMYQRHRFDQAAAALERFDKTVRQVPAIADLVEQEKKRCERLRRTAFFQNRKKAESLIADGAVEAVKSLQKETLAFAPQDYHDEINQWTIQARRRKLTQGQPASVAQTPPTDPERPGPEGTPPPDTPSPPETTQESPDKPAPSETATEMRESVFSSLVTIKSPAPQGNSFTLEKLEDTLLSYRPAKTDVFLDTHVPRDRFQELLPKGSGVWILGIPRIEKKALQPFGPTIVKRVQKPTFLFLADNFLPEPSWNDPDSPPRKWYSGTTALSFPVLRVQIKEETFYVDSTKVTAVKREKTNLSQTAIEGKTVLVEGIREGREIKAERIVILAPSLVENELYLEFCR